MTYLHAVVLGLLQGLGEFLPVSSSAHLALAPWLFRWPDPGLEFDIALHLGTLLAVLMFFWRDWVRLLGAGLRGVSTPDGRLFWYLVAATIPGGVAGVLLEKKAATVFRSPVLIGTALIVMGVVLYLADQKGRKRDDLGRLRFGHAFLIGVSQMLAIVPGVSRSGITMATGLAEGLDREAAARFSFLLSAPIIAGSGLLPLRHILKNPHLVTGPWVAGVLTAAVVGVASIGFLLNYLRRGTFKVFAWYRLALGLFVIAVALVRH